MMLITKIVVPLVLKSQSLWSTWNSHDDLTQKNEVSENEVNIFAYVLQKSFSLTTFLTNRSKKSQKRLIEIKMLHKMMAIHFHTSV